ncbi:MAG TPA: glycerol-3-phosphate dehydrogenase/oxidase [Bryobacteraceae bacterium]|jgi:glycerol-3-phosphate dehydrogenase|nr:glycerol-3-phosphate dehydrogenase/oxidase [Bryobacteraceae bacterium]
MTRPEMLTRLHSHTAEWDIIVIGGGATGVGVAIDAASRGYDTLLLEGSDFGKGTSSRSTKLVHGGVRYLEQGNVSLVMEALKERGILRQNAPHLVSDLAFVVPNYDWWEAPFYGLGLKLYNLLSGKYGFGPSRILSREETLERLPTLSPDGLRGGVVYYDGQFDDARLLINMVATAAEQGATLLNYARVTGLTKDTDGFVNGVMARDEESGQNFTALARIVVNATGPWTDQIRQYADASLQPMISPSQGIHLVFDRSFLPASSAIMVPHTSDGRVMFAIPWHGHTLVGTTDTPIAEAPLDPSPLETEIEFILQTSAEYLHHAPARSDILSVFAGIRPLVKAGSSGNTAALSRDHTIHIDESGLLNITGGKWTTYRHMAEDCVNHAMILGKLPERECVTKRLNIHGFYGQSQKFGHLSVYGSDAPAIQELIQSDAALGQRLTEALPYIGAEVIWAARNEMARTVEDVLARRTRALFLNHQAAVDAAPKVASLMMQELGVDEVWRSQQLSAFESVARHFQPPRA